MKNLELPIPANSPILCAHTTVLGNSSIKILVIDFENLSSSQTNPLVFSQIAKEYAMVIKCDFPSALILDVLFLVTNYSNGRRILLDTKAISQENLTLLKKIGLDGLSTELNCNYSRDRMQEAKISANEAGTAISKLGTLSKTELIILYYVSLGLTNGQIAELACRSYHTVKNHKLNIVRKVGFDHCYELFELCQRLKLTSI